MCNLKNKVNKQKTKMHRYRELREFGGLDEKVKGIKEYKFEVTK